MNYIRSVLTFWLLILLAGCSSYYYLANNLNSLQMGMSKSDFIENFSGRTSNGPDAEPAILRASQQQRNGDLVEVFTMAMIEPDEEVTSYWFVFRNGRLNQWGRPEDWQQVSGRYEISFNPAAAVR